MKKPTTAPTTRVAIYARASVSRASEFDSVTAQVEACSAYIDSQRSNGWLRLPDPFIDDGYSGGNVDRPAFTRLMADVESGKVDAVCVYKLDRLSRSLVDFARVVESLEKRGVALVSVTQSFSTATSLGKLTLGILMSFAQFEREQISERTRDKIAATRKKGLWTGGRPVLGYDVRDKALVVNRTEADVVRTIFDLYLAHGGLVTTVAELERRGIRNKSWTNKAGKHVRGEPFDKSTLRALLTNPLYIGRVRCGDELVDGRHEAIIDVATFEAVARALSERRRPYRQQLGRLNALLTGLVRCSRCGSAMSHASNIRGDRVHRYYVCSAMVKQGATACPGSRAPAAELEDVVVNRIRLVGTDPSVLVATLTAAQQARRAHEPELAAEARRLTGERTHLAAERTNLLDALQHGSVAANPIARRIAEVDEKLARLQERHDEVTTQLAAMANDTVDEAEVRAALQQFTAAWDELVPRERARVLRLLIDEVRFDGQAGEVTISFRDNGIRALGRETTARRPA